MDKSLTLFTMPKPFHGHFGVIQRNALRSWSKLPRVEILLLGNEAGTGDLARELGARHVADVERNEHGTPLVSAMFAAADRVSRTECLAYVNADIILAGDFRSAVNRVPFETFLMIGRRWDVDVRAEIDFHDPGWEDRLRDRLRAEGSLHPSPGLDYFVYRRGMWGAVPPFALGRTAWDNWLLFRAKQLRVPVIDATPTVRAVHQNHDYSHAPGGAKAVWEGPEARRNQELCGSDAFFYATTDADWALGASGLSRVYGGRFYRSLRRVWVALPSPLQRSVRLAVNGARAAPGLCRALTRRARNTPER